MATLGEQVSGLVIGALKSVRRNSADSAFEAFTPMSVVNAATTSAALAVSQNNYAPATKSLFVRLNATAAIDLTGLSYTTNEDGEIHFLANFGTANITVKNNNALSTAGNRFLLSADIIIMPEQVVGVIYDLASIRWRALVN